MQSLASITCFESRLGTMAIMRRVLDRKYTLDTCSDETDLSSRLIQWAKRNKVRTEPLI